MVTNHHWVLEVGVSAVFPTEETRRLDYMVFLEGIRTG